MSGSLPRKLVSSTSAAFSSDDEGGFEAAAARGRQSATLQRLPPQTHFHGPRSGRQSAEPFSRPPWSNRGLPATSPNDDLDALDLSTLDLRNLDPATAKKMLDDIRSGADIKVWSKFTGFNIDSKFIEVSQI